MKKIIPSVDSLQSAAEDIRLENEPRCIEKKLERFVNYYDALNYQISYGAPLLRARKCERPEGYKSLQDVHYPPAHLTKANRLNEAGQPLLYVSFTQFTALAEIGAKRNEHVHIVGYSQKPERPIRALIIGEFTNVHKCGKSNLPGVIGEKINKILNKMDLEPGLSFVYMDAFLSSLLADPRALENEYKHSRLLAKILFRKYPQIEAIHYPSVARNDAMNLAIKPRAADEGLRVAGTSVLNLKEQFDHGLCRFSIVKNARGYGDGGEIFWQ